jgi:nanoRNase/pAp phosphatase (c-di-AMP/oligoRNAs hydrolase)
LAASVGQRLDMEHKAMELPDTNPLTQDDLQRLREVAGSGPVLILTHDNPDPDALASGKALAELLQDAWQIRSRLFYSGLVLRVENQAMLIELTPEWEHCDAPADLDSYSAVALVDTQPGAGNNRLARDHRPQIVIDHHHPLRETLPDVPFVDVRPEIGATVTMVDQYLDRAGVKIDSDLATAMFYGIKTDTRGLSRGTTEADMVTYLRLLAQIDRSKLIQIEQAGLPVVYFQAFSDGLRATRLYDHALVADLGDMHRPDLPAELADLLIRLKGARAALCLGVHEQTLYLSVRTKPMGQDAGLLVQKIIIPPGSAGGHGTMAGGQFQLDGRDPGPLATKLVAHFLEIMGESGPGKSLT